MAPVLLLIIERVVVVKVLIIDDNPYDLEQIRDIVLSYKNIDIEISALCNDSLAGLEIARLEKPEIIICDIEMPGMNGIQLAKHIHRELPETKIVFCSAHPEFDYVREALYLDIYGYVLKPVDKEELKQCIINVTNRVDKELIYQHQRENMARILEENRPLIIQSYIKNLLFGINEDIEDFWEKVKLYGIPISPGFYIVALLEIDDFSEININNNIKDREYLSLKIYDKIKRQVDRLVDIVIARMDESHFAIVFSIKGERVTKEQIQGINSFCESLVQEFNNSDVSITTAVSNITPELSQINCLYEQCSYIMRFKYSLGKAKVIYSDEVPESLSAPSFDLNALKTDLRYLLNSGMREEISAYIESLFANTLKDTNEQTIKNLCFYIIICIQIILSERDESFQSVFSSENIIWDKLLRFETILDTKNWLMNITYFIHDYLSEKSTTSNGLLVKKIKEYIAKHDFISIQLENISEELYYSPNYLNRIYKKATGETIYDYIIRCRMEKASEMLKDSSVKLYEVAEKLGYTNITHFTNIFKKYIGMKPKEYREKYI